MNIHMAALAGGLVTGVLTMAHFAVYRRQIFAGAHPRQRPRQFPPLLVADASALAFSILLAVMVRWALVPVAPGNPRWAIEGVRYLVDIGLVGVALVLAAVDAVTVWRNSRDE